MESRDTGQFIPCFDILRDPVVTVMHARPRAIPLAIITMRKSTRGCPFLSDISMQPFGVFFSK